MPLEDMELQLQGIDDDQNEGSEARAFLDTLHEEDQNL